MCGLVGVAGDTSGYRKDVFTILLVVDALRGMHSTGVASVERHSGKVKSAKEPGGPSNVMATAEYREALLGGPKLLIGHNRYATVGAHTSENAHPFVFDNIIGAHNGTLHASDRQKLHDFDKYGTDSQAIFADIEQFGIDETIPKLTDYDSAYALTWFNKKDNTIHFLRNNKRPLYYTYSVDRCTLFWASEIRFIEFAAAQANVKIMEIFAPEDDMHVWWEIPKGINDKFGQPFKMLLKPTKSYNYAGPEFYENGVWYKGYRKDKDDHKHQHGKKKDNVLLFSRQRKDTKGWRPPYKDSRGHILNKADFEKITDQGCCFCGTANQNWGEFIQPFRCGVGPDYDYLCKECYDDDDTYDLCKNMI